MSPEKMGPHNGALSQNGGRDSLFVCEIGGVLFKHRLSAEVTYLAARAPLPAQFAMKMPSLHKCSVLCRFSWVYVMPIDVVVRADFGCQPSLRRRHPAARRALPLAVFTQ